MLTVCVNLNNVFVSVKSTGKSVRYGDLLCIGFPSFLIDSFIADLGANVSLDKEGYSVITLN